MNLNEIFFYVTKMLNASDFIYVKACYFILFKM